MDEIKKQSGTQFLQRVVHLRACMQKTLPSTRLTLHSLWDSVSPESGPSMHLSADNPFYYIGLTVHSLWDSVSPDGGPCTHLSAGNPL